MKITIGIADARLNAINKSPDRKERYDRSIKELDNTTKTRNKIKKLKVDKTLIDFLNERDKIGKCVKCEKQHESICPKNGDLKDNSDVKDIDVRA